MLTPNVKPIAHVGSSPHSPLPLPQSDSVPNLDMVSERSAWGGLTPSPAVLDGEPT